MTIDSGQDSPESPHRSQPGLFGDPPATATPTTPTVHERGYQPLAARLRPATLEDYAGQQHILGPGKPLRQVDHQLELFDCVACNNCVTVCPNDAFLSIPSREMEGLQARAQYLVLAELCNDCGNCTTFCPEEGAPHLIKPRLFTTAGAWEQVGQGGYLLQRDPQGEVTVAGPGPRETAVVKSLVDREKWLSACLDDPQPK